MGVRWGGGNLEMILCDPRQQQLTDMKTGGMVARTAGQEDRRMRVVINRNPLEQDYSRACARLAKEVNPFPLEPVAH